MDDRGILELLMEMVKAPSHPGVPRQEEAAALALAGYLRERGLPADLVEVREGRPNVVASIAGAKPGPHLLLCGHLDTVPPNAGSAADFFSAAIRDERMFGRGTVDMKGALAAMAGALVEIRDSGGLASGRVTLAAVIDEEMESLGAEALIRSGFQADGAVIGEPTENRVAIGHKGSGVARGRVHRPGRPRQHARGRDQRDRRRGPFRLACRRRARPGLREAVATRSWAFRPSTWARSSGGQQPSMVAADCTIQLDRRWVTTETIDQVMGDLEAILAKVREARPGLKTRLERMPGGMATMLHGPLVIDPAHPLVEAALGAFGDLGRAAAPTSVFPAWTDGALLSREAGIPTLVWGPGELALAHSAEESVPLDEILLAARLYAAAARRFTAAR